jgi:hypothetical protein
VGCVQSYLGPEDQDEPNYKCNICNKVKFNEMSQREKKYFFVSTWLWVNSTLN